MSLDITLLNDKKIIKEGGTGVFFRENGQTKELSLKEVKEKFPNYKGELEEQRYETNVVFEANITHNLGQMAKNAYIYYPLWRPEEKGWTRAKDITKHLEKGLAKLKSDPEKFKQFNPSNGWGSYENLVNLVENYLEACKKYPDATIDVDK